MKALWWALMALGTVALAVAGALICGALLWAFFAHWCLEALWQKDRKRLDREEL